MKSPDVEMGTVQDEDNNTNLKECVSSPPHAVIVDKVGNDCKQADNPTPPFPVNDVIVELNSGSSPISTLTPSPGDAIPKNNDKRYYPGDVVAKKGNGISNKEWLPQFGTVMKPIPGSEMDKNRDKGSSSKFSVNWEFTNQVETVEASQVSIVDRILLRGQKVENEKGEKGTIVDYAVTAAVQIIGTHHVIESVPLNRLRPISTHVRGQEILLNGWVGVIASVKRNVWFRMDGGSIFYIETNESDGFIKTDPYWGHGAFFIGMRTRLSSSVLKNAVWMSHPLKFFSKWLPIHYLYQWAHNTIIQSETTEIEVVWLQRVPGTSSGALQPPPKLRNQDLHNIIVIGAPSTETIGINSVRKLRVWPQDNLTNIESWMQDFRNKVDGSGLDPTQLSTFTNPPPREDGTENSVKILLRHNIVTVQWETGLVESILAIKINRISLTVDDGEFPMGVVVSPLQKDSANGEKYGIIMESNDLAKTRSRMVNVRWIKNGTDEGTDQVSVFDIIPHSLYSMYMRGTIVFPRNPSKCKFASGVVTDTDVSLGKMIIIRSSDNLRDEVRPHQVIALSKRCHWSFFTRKWIVDDLILPPYQLELEYDPSKRNFDVSEQNLNVLDIDNNNPEDPSNFTTLWDEPSFEQLGFAPETHRFYKSASSENFGKGFSQKIEKELVFMRDTKNIPEGIWIRCYENRLDLISVLMVGPSKTPYEDGLFLFDIQLSAEYPAVKPALHFVSYTQEIHPLLSFDGNVCVGGIPWNASDAMEHSSSYLCEFLYRLQELLFTPTPYCVDEQKKGELSTERGQIKSRLYNQGVVVRTLDAAWGQLQNPYDPWKKCIRNHFASVFPDKIFSVEKWLNFTDDEEGLSKVLLDAFNVINDDIPSYPLLPIPLGFKVAVKPRIELFKKLLNTEHMQPVVRICSVNDTTADSESHPVVQTAEEAPRCLTPIAEITEPSSTSTFDGKVSSSVSVPNSYPAISLDSLKNIKRHDKNKTTAAASDSDSEQEHLDLDTNPVIQ